MQHAHTPFFINPATGSDAWTDDDEHQNRSSGFSMCLLGVFMAASLVAVGFGAYLWHTKPEENTGMLCVGAGIVVFGGTALMYWEEHRTAQSYL